MVQQPGGTVPLGLHWAPRPTDALPKERFGVVSPSNEQFELLARLYMEGAGIAQGDMLNIEKRVGVHWAGPAATTPSSARATTLSRMETAPSRAERMILRGVERELRSC